MSMLVVAVDAPWCESHADNISLCKTKLQWISDLDFLSVARLAPAITDNSLATHNSGLSPQSVG